MEWDHRSLRTDGAKIFTGQGALKIQSKSINDPLYINHTLCVDVKSAV